MSLLSDIYVASPEAATSYDEQQTVADGDRAQLPGVTFLELSTLWALLEAREWEDSYMNAFACVFERDGGERLIYSLPTQFVARLASLDAGSIQSAAELWSQTEELACSAADVVPGITEMAEVARRGEQSGRRLYIWTCV